MELCNTAAIRPIVFLLQQVPTFISRGATHHTDAGDLYQRRWELLLMNFASKLVIYGNLLGSFTYRKAGTWDILFYFPSEERHSEDFPDARKIQRLRPGLNPRTRVPVTSMLTTRPPKPSKTPQRYANELQLFLLSSTFATPADHTGSQSKAPHNSSRRISQHVR